MPGICRGPGQHRSAGLSYSHVTQEVAPEPSAGAALSWAPRQRFQAVTPEHIEQPLDLIHAQGVTLDLTRGGRTDLAALRCTISSRSASPSEFRISP